MTFSPAKSSSDYSDILLLPNPASTKPELPPDDASPAEVREFLVDLLVVTRKLPETHANEIASKWKLGTGHELTTYQPQMFQHLFGIEEGWVVYKEAKLLAQIKLEKDNAPSEAEFEKNLRRWLPICALITLSFATAAMFTSNEILQGIGIAFGAFGGIGTFTLAIGVSFPPEKLSAETTVENKLKKEYWNTASASRSTGK